MDIALRALYRTFSGQPTLQNLVSLLTGLVRSGDYDSQLQNLITLLRETGPFHRSQWPWLTREGDYKAQAHTDILTLLLSIKPITSLLDFSQHPTDLIHALSLVRRELLKPPEDDEEAAQYPEFWEMRNYPQFITAEIIKYNNELPSYAEHVVVTIVDEPGPFPLRQANRYCVDLNGEPPGLMWRNQWHNMAGRWMVVDSEGWSSGQRESETFLPYKKFCNSCNQNRENCVPCKVCQDRRGHDCQCMQCFYCEKWVNNWDSTLVPEELRCRCAD